MTPTHCIRYWSMGAPPQRPGLGRYGLDKDLQYELHEPHRLRGVVMQNAVLAHAPQAAGQHVPGDAVQKIRNR